MPTMTQRSNIEAYLRAAKDFIEYWGKQQSDPCGAIIGSTVTTDKLYERFVMYSDLGPAIASGEASGVPFKNIQTPFKKDFYMTNWYLGTRISINAYKKSRIAAIKNPTKNIARGHYLARQYEIADKTFNNCTSTGTDYVGIDAKAKAATDHPTLTSTYSNLTALPLSAANLETMWANAESHKTYTNAPFEMMGGYKLITTLSQDRYAYRILNSTLQQGTVDNDTNALRGKIQYVPGIKYLTGSTQHHLIPANNDENPFFILQGMDLTMFDQFDINDPCQKFAGIQEWGVGMFHPFGVQFNLGV